jgi:hypothetical protein
MPASNRLCGAVVIVVSRARTLGRTAVALAVAVLAQHGGAWGDEPLVGCSVPHFDFVDNGQSRANMYVKAGGVCGFHFRVRGGISGKFGVLGNSVSRPPRHGIVGKASIYQFAYKPNAGYVGDDDFDLRVRYDRYGVKTETTLHVSVSVSANMR